MKCFSRSRLCDGSYWPSNHGQPPGGLLSSEGALGENLATPLLMEAADLLHWIWWPQTTTGLQKIPEPSL